MKKVSLALAIAAIMVGSSAMSATDESASKPVTEAVASSSTQTVAAAPAIKGMDAELVKAAALAYVEKDTAMKGGEFLIYDDTKGNKRVWRLKKPVVDGEPVVQAEDASVVSAVFVTTKKGDKNKITVDFQVKKGASGSLDVTSIMIRKVNKNERFIYDDQGQVAPVPKKAKKKSRR